jgi:phosphate:Na+ symporter
MTSGMALRLLNTLGALTVFIVGMRLLSDGIRAAAGYRLQNVINVMTRNRFSALFIGGVGAFVLQSSAASVVLLVGIANAGLIPLRQGLAVILGANVGTTVTAWLVTLFGFEFDISAVGLPLVAFSLPLLLWPRKRVRDLGAIPLGAGLLFVSVMLMRRFLPDLDTNPELMGIILHLTSYGFFSILIYAGVGVAVAVVLQSSTAAILLTVALASKGWVTFPIAAAIVLGSNVGTTLTTVLSAVPLGAAARRTAISHTLVNLVGLCWALPLFYPLLALSDLLVPQSPHNVFHMPIHLTVFHTTFNVINAVIFLPLVAPLSALIKRVWKASKREDPLPYHFPMGNPQETATSVVIPVIRAEAGKMADRAYGMLLLFLNATQSKGDDLDEIGERFRAEEQYIDAMFDEISRFITEALVYSGAEKETRQINALLKIVNEIEVISDSLFALIFYFVKREKKKIAFHRRASKEIGRFTARIVDFLNFNADYLRTNLPSFDLSTAQEMRYAISQELTSLQKIAGKKIGKGGELKGEMMYINILHRLEIVNQACYTMSQAIDEYQNVN